MGRFSKKNNIPILRVSAKRIKILMREEKDGDVTDVPLHVPTQIVIRRDAQRASAEI